MADPTPQRNPPVLLGEVNDGDIAIFRVNSEGGIFIASGGAVVGGVTGPTGTAGVTGPTGVGATGAASTVTGPTGPTGP